ncbi:unnamed protein product, partial [Allacma fusca]
MQNTRSMQVESITWNTSLASEHEPFVTKWSRDTRIPASCCTSRNFTLRSSGHFCILFYNMGNLNILLSLRLCIYALGICQKMR